MSRLFSTMVIISVGLAACGTAPAPTTIRAPTDAPATAVPATDSPTSTAAPTTSLTAAPTLGFTDYLLTQAYSAFTPQAAPTEIVVTPTATHTGGSVAATATPAQAVPAAASLYLAEPIQIPNAVNSADCKIRDLGDCTTTMPPGVTVFFTFTFGVAGAEKFSWGNAAVVVARDGQQFAWSQVGNGLVTAPDFTKNESWTLNVGQQAEFRSGLENIQPGHYTARLAMCTLSPDECDAGQGWQNVGGDAIDFVINPANPNAGG